MAVEEPNLAPVIAEIEVTAPAPNNSGDGQVSTTLPTTATGIIANTSIDVSNNDLSHSCDFALTLQKNNALKYSLRECLEWFKEIEKSWSIPTFEQGRLVICNDVCGQKNNK